MEIEEHAADLLAGGLMRGYQCGMVWGAALAAGAQVYRTFGKGPQAEARAILSAQRMVESFRSLNKSVDCREITGIDLGSPSMWSITRFLVKSMPTGTCFGMAARYAPVAFQEINTALSEERIGNPNSPVSCAACVAQKMGASDQQTVMAAGFAGGIGLSGGACGALGAAIWITSMNAIREGEGTIGNNLAGAGKVIAGFLQVTGGKSECSEIVGRKFEDASDHAGYLREGGCAEIIQALAGRDY